VVSLARKPVDTRSDKKPENVFIPNVTFRKYQKGKTGKWLNIL